MTGNKFIMQGKYDEVRVHVDTDHAGCALTRRSTTGQATVWARRCVTHGHEDLDC